MHSLELRSLNFWERLTNEGIFFEPKSPTTGDKKDLRDITEATAEIYLTSAEIYLTLREIFFLNLCQIHGIIRLNLPNIWQICGFLEKINLRVITEARAEIYLTSAEI